MHPLPWVSQCSLVASTKTNKQKSSHINFHLCLFLEQTNVYCCKSITGGFQPPSPNCTVAEINKQKQNLTPPKYRYEWQNKSLTQTQKVYVYMRSEHTCWGGEKNKQTKANLDLIKLQNVKITEPPLLRTVGFLLLQREEAGHQM